MEEEGFAEVEAKAKAVIVQITVAVSAGRVEGMRARAMQ